LPFLALFLRQNIRRPNSGESCILFEGKKATMPIRKFLTFAGILRYAIQRKSQALLRMAVQEELHGV
jgi:hypothetical protein